MKNKIEGDNKDMIENIDSKSGENRIYRSVRIIDGKPKCVIVDENGKVINKYPDKEELKLVKQNDDNIPKINKIIYKTDEIKPVIIPIDELEPIVKRTRKYSTDTCNRCGENFSLSGHGTHYKEKIEKKWTGKFICHRCYMKDRNNLPDSYNNLKKQIGNRRTGNLRPDSEQILGDMFQRWTCVCFCVEDMNIVKNDHNYRVDHDNHPKYGILETVGRKLNIEKNVYSLSWGMENKKTQPFDNLIFWCTDPKYKLETGYIFPKEVLMNRKSITITRGCRIGWYEKFRISESIIEDYKIIIKDNYLTYDEFIKNHCR